LLILAGFASYSDWVHDKFEDDSDCAFVISVHMGLRCFLPVCFQRALPTDLPLDPDVVTATLPSLTSMLIFLSFFAPFYDKVLNPSQCPCRGEAPHR